MTDRQLLELLVDKVTGLETGMDCMKTNISGLKTEMAEVRSDIGGLKTEMTEVKMDLVGVKTETSGLKETVNRIAKRQEAIFEQTAGLLEFRMEMISSVRELKENQRSIFEVLGEHEVQIRNLKRCVCE